MIYKSYQVEENFKILKNNIILFYGENLGLISDFKREISLNKKLTIFRFTQNEIVNNEQVFFDQINNNNLFFEEKIFFIQDANDKFLRILEELILKEGHDKVFIFANTLEKKSKLRNFCEKNKKIDVVPCYKDDENNFKKIITKKLKEYSGVTNNIIKLISEKCNNDRSNLFNEIEKIKVFFINKKINYDELDRLLNEREDNEFGLIKDMVMNGNLIGTNKLLNTIILETEKSSFYLAVINQRFMKLREVLTMNNSNVESAISALKPPIFWKDRPNFLIQSKLWNNKKINLALKKTYDVETKLKSNSNLDKKVVLKKLLVDICNFANVA